MILEVIHVKITEDPQMVTEIPDTREEVLMVTEIPDTRGEA
jgi:hypothetical protein